MIHHELLTLLLPLALGTAVGALVTLGAMRAALRRTHHAKRRATPAPDKLHKSRELRRLKTLTDNIDAYDGTGRGQKKVV
ncbi:MAG: hypothetical protein RRY21_04220 [Oscillospiraceae bacterium]